MFIVGGDAARAELARRHHPPLSDQGLAIESSARDGGAVIVVGGGSPRATLWAVYALAQRWGVRPLLHGDLLPPPRPFELPHTPSRIVKRRTALKGIPAKEVPSVLIYTLHDDNVGVLPQLTTHALAELTYDLREQGWAGFSTRYWLLGDHDPCVAYLARAAWDANATPEDVDRDLVLHACGEAAVPDMLSVFREVEAATETLEWHGLGLTFTVPGMMMKHWTPEPLPAELKAVAPRYQAARAAAARALAATATPAGRAYVQYWIGRLDFGIDYLDAVDAVRAAAKAEAQGDRAGTLRDAERALRRATDAVTAYAAVARDRSDRGAIAMMNEYVIRPLRAKVGALRHPGRA